MSGVIGAGMDRVDGPAKVTGAARYAADTPLPDLTHAVLVQCTIAKGRIIAIDTAAAEAAPGVLGVITHRNAPRLTSPGTPVPPGQSHLPMQDDVVHYNGQHIAMVVAETLEQAQHAASLVRAEYRSEKPVATVAEGINDAFVPPPAFRGPHEHVRGDSAGGWAAAKIRVEASYATPTQHHNPMEPSATVAAWDGDALTLYESTQGISGTRGAVAARLGIPPDQVRVVAPFLGGGFGAKGPAWPHTFLTAAVAKEIGRPVKLVLTRAHTYSAHGHRAECLQTIRLGATREGKLTAIEHVATSQTSRFTNATPNFVDASEKLYACPNARITERVVQLDLGAPWTVRSPSSTGVHALESALDELAYATGIDPIELRLRNHADADPDTGEPFQPGVKSLKDCYAVGAERFGWQRRDPRPRSMRDGAILIGWGMASAFHGNNRASAAATAELSPDGGALLRCGTQDIGTGTGTVMTQVAADRLGLPAGSVRFELGDTRYPPGPGSFGSQTINSITPAVYQAAGSARDQVIQLAVADPRSPLHGVAADRVTVADGRLFLTDDPSRGETYQQVLTRHGQAVQARGDSTVTTPGEAFSYGATFAEVRVDPDLGEIRVARMVGAFAAGRILNHKTARSQAIGGLIWGIGMALMEHTVTDRNLGRILTPNLSTYLIPVEADVPDIDVHFIDRPDSTSSALGARGLGEVTATGMSAAIGNAIYHATGRRVRDLPITPDKLL